MTKFKTDPSFDFELLLSIGNIQLNSGKEYCTFMCTFHFHSNTSEFSVLIFDIAKFIEAVFHSGVRN